MNTNSWVSAAAAASAFIAAVLSALTLYFTGRRETRKWLRETLLDAVAQFLDGSFSRPHRRIYLLRQQGGEAHSLAKLGAQADEAYRAQADALTKIRLLASRELVEAAEELHEADDHMSKQVIRAKALPTRQDYEALRSRQRLAREALINEARHVLGLHRGVAITNYRTTSLDGEGAGEL